MTRSGNTSSGRYNDMPFPIVPDVEPEAFLALLKYLYCDEIQLEPDSVLATLYAAKKYIVPHLARECVKYLETSLSGIS
jgi:BTB/POZ domain-containing protein 3/6